jgi:hypothetical protein
MILAGRLVAGIALFVCTAAAVAAPLHRYLVRVDDSLERLAVSACFDGAAPQALVTGSDAAFLYLESMQARGHPAAIPVARGAATLPALPDNTCIDYVVQLKPARAGAQTGGPETRRIGRDLLTAIGDWLWRPEAFAPGEDLEIRFELPGQVAVSAPWQPVEGQPLPTFRVGATPARWPGVVAFGGFQAIRIPVGSAQIELAILDGPPPEQQAFVQRWIAGAARGVATAFGNFPVPRLQVVVSPTPRGRAPVPWAYVGRGGGPAVHFFINATRDHADFERDWTATHEMTHLFLPYLGPGDVWFYEGLATYLQNVLMARAGTIGADEAWRRLHDGFERGSRTAPGLSILAATERLGRAGTYVRVYWGGAAVFLAADLRLRETGAGSLDDALAELSRCCNDDSRRWSADEIIAELDSATGTTVFSDIAREMLKRPEFPDTAALLGQLGVQVIGDRVTYNDNAPLAAQREAIMAPR